ncbi:hypothetical protein TanjilG_31360 [Lupinus angustifolius]|uniref:Uncharacterized protein n=1 Tax=Lupinus angustifolius TaxID=3871 RepID=A0A1J7IH23_LUPAN|nr:hypothetical protein TanjilG_31360 [Lupinus angustifolius]
MSGRALAMVVTSFGTPAMGGGACPPEDAVEKGGERLQWLQERGMRDIFVWPWFSFMDLRFRWTMVYRMWC